MYCIFPQIKDFTYKLFVVSADAHSFTFINYVIERHHLSAVHPTTHKLLYTQFMFQCITLKRNVLPCLCRCPVIIWYQMKENWFVSQTHHLHRQRTWMLEDTIVRSPSCPLASAVNRNSPHSAVNEPRRQRLCWCGGIGSVCQLIKPALHFPWVRKLQVGNTSTRMLIVGLLFAGGRGPGWGEGYSGPFCSILLERVCLSQSTHKVKQFLDGRINYLLTLKRLKLDGSPPFSEEHI